MNCSYPSSSKPNELLQTFLSHFTTTQELQSFLHSQSIHTNQPIVSKRKQATTKLYKHLDITTIKSTSPKKCQFTGCKTSSKQPYVCDDKFYCSTHIRLIASQKKLNKKQTCQHIFHTSDQTTCTLPCQPNSKYCCKHRKKSETIN